MRLGRGALMALLGEPLEEPRIRRTLKRLISAGAQIKGYLMILPHGEEYAVRLPARSGMTGRRLPPSYAEQEPMHSGLWAITDHLCRECLGRLVVRMDGPEDGAYRCTVCGAGTTDAVETLCACGGRLKEGEDLGMRCVRNPKRTYEFPHEIVVARVKLDHSTPEAAHQRALPLRST